MASRLEVERAYRQAEHHLDQAVAAVAHIIDLLHESAQHDGTIDSGFGLLMAEELTHKSRNIVHAASYLTEAGATVSKSMEDFAKTGFIPRAHRHGSGVRPAVKRRRR